MRTTLRMTRGIASRPLRVRRRGLLRGVGETLLKPSCTGVAAGSGHPFGCRQFCPVCRAGWSNTRVGLSRKYIGTSVTDRVINRALGR